MKRWEFENEKASMMAILLRVEVDSLTAIPGRIKMFLKRQNVNVSSERRDSLSLFISSCLSLFALFAKLLLAESTVCSGSIVHSF